MAFLMPQCQRVVSRGMHLVKPVGIALPEEPLLPKGDSKAEIDFLGRRFSVSLLPCTGSLPLGSPLQTWEEAQISPSLRISPPGSSGPASLLVGQASCLYLAQQLQSGGEGVDMDPAELHLPLGEGRGHGSP